MENTQKLSVSPGEMLCALIGQTGVNRQEFASLMGIDRQMLYKLMNDMVRISPMYARAIERAWPSPSNRAADWMSAQAAWDLHLYDAENRHKRVAPSGAALDQVAERQRRNRMVSGTHRREAT